MSGSVTTSTRGVPARFRSQKLRFSAAEWMFLPASFSIWIRVMPIFFGPFGVSISSQPCSQMGRSNWEIW